jgi:hypothetical protein
VDPAYTPASSEPGYAGATEPGYAAGTPVSTEYASTGTGTPVVVEEDYVAERREPRP